MYQILKRYKIYTRRFTCITYGPHEVTYSTRTAAVRFFLSHLISKLPSICNIIAVLRSPICLPSNHRMARDRGELEILGGNCRMATDMASIGIHRLGVGEGSGRGMMLWQCWCQWCFWCGGVRDGGDVGFQEVVVVVVGSKWWWWQCCISSCASIRDGDDCGGLQVEVVVGWRWRCRNGGGDCCCWWW